MGALTALAGFVFFYIGAIPGLLLVILSIRLLRASKSAKRLNYNLRLIQSEQEMYDETLSLFASYFKLQAFLILLILLYIAVISSMLYFVPLDYVSLIQEQVKTVTPFL